LRIEEKFGSTAEPKFASQVTLVQLLGRTAMTNLRISDLLLLTCCGAFIASFTYAVKLSIEAF
jgi:hypothetical protein